MAEDGDRMYTTYEIAKAMTVVARNLKQKAAGEFLNRALDTIEWAENHLTEHEKHMVSRLAGAL